jgi:hypothetical protein
MTPDNAGGSGAGASRLLSDARRKTRRTMIQISQARTCVYCDFVADFIWNRSGKSEFGNPYFATKEAIPPVCLSIITFDRRLTTA